MYASDEQMLTAKIIEAHCSTLRRKRRSMPRGALRHRTCMWCKRNLRLHYKVHFLSDMRPSGGRPFVPRAELLFKMQLYSKSKFAASNTPATFVPDLSLLEVKCLPLLLLQCVTQQYYAYSC